MLIMVLSRVVCDDLLNLALAPVHPLCSFGRRAICPVMPYAKRDSPWVMKLFPVAGLLVNMNWLLGPRICRTLCTVRLRLGTRRSIVRLMIRLKALLGQGNALVLVIWFLSLKFRRLVPCPVILITFGDRLAIRLLLSIFVSPRPSRKKLAL